MDEDVLIKAGLKAQAIFDANNTTLTVAECAAWLNCHHRTVKNKINKGIIKATYSSGEWRIPKIQFLDKIIEGFERTTVAQSI